MKKIDELDWDVKKVKERGFEWFSENIALWEGKTCQKATKTEVKKLYEKLTGKKLNS